MKTDTRKLRIGVYAGAFDPVHAGHVAFALQAVKAAKLDQVVFMPERRPRYKPGVEHYAHRMAMLKAALMPHADLAVMEVVDRHFTVRRTLPLLQSLYTDADIVFLMGSDTFMTVPDWQHADQLMQKSEFIVGVRSQHQQAIVERSVAQWPVALPAVMIFESFAPNVSSSTVREALRSDQYVQGLLASVRRYARQEWLYVSPGTLKV